MEQDEGLTWKPKRQRHAGGRPPRLKVVSMNNRLDPYDMAFSTLMNKWYDAGVCSSNWTFPIDTTPFTYPYGVGTSFEDKKAEMRANARRLGIIK